MRSLPQRLRSNGIARELAPLGVLLALLVIVTIMRPSFIAGTGVQVVLYQALPILVLALGQLWVIIIGGIDLSSAAIAILCAVVVAQTVGPLGGLAPILAIAVGALAGLLNGAVATYFQVPSFAVTLGALGVWQAVALMVSNDNAVYISKNGQVLSWLTDFSIGGLQLATWTGIVLTALAWIVMRWTRFGSYLRAIGLNERGAILSSVPTVRVKIAAFTMSGLFAGMAGVILTAQQGAASATGLGVGLMLPSIAAAVVGGAAITGGIGNPLNVMVGSLIIALISVGGTTIGVDPRVQQIVYGAVVILAVLATIDRSKLRVVK